MARTIVQLGGTIHEEATAKTRAGDRLVFLDHNTASPLREHRKARVRRSWQHRPARGRTTT